MEAIRGVVNHRFWTVVHFINYPGGGSETEPNSACQFLQKHTAARGPRTGLLSSKIESIDGRVKF